MKNLIKIVFIVLVAISPKLIMAQSFYNEKTSAINFIRRVYNSSPFEGAKKIDGENESYYAVAVSFPKISPDSILSYASVAFTKAQTAAEQGFAEPCVKFEMVGTIDNNETVRTSYIFLCETLRQFITTLYKKEPFEGTKKIDSENKSYYAVVVSFPKISPDSILSYTSVAFTRAQTAAEQGFAEPCVKFEMIGTIDNNETVRTSYIFLCETLGQFITTLYKKKPFEGAKIISAPNNKYFVDVISLDNSKYTTVSARDKVAQMKAKQLANTLLNGSTISSESIIRTDENDKATEVANTEIIREQAMGFIDGIELLISFENADNKTTYIYYKSITK